ncbi:MAG: acetate/propionate family kinase [Alphaproteobacteria bacterium]|nr:acetate/propionate family kinase [Alphaproteobacteria bacterium]
MTRAIACLNAGSSSIKFALFILAADGPRHAAAGKLEGIGVSPRLVARDISGAILIDRAWDHGADLTHEVLLRDIFEWAGAHLEGREIVGLGHRVVHGGGRFSAAVRLDDQVLTTLETFSPLAPLHQPHNLAAIRAIQALAPDLPQVACFDTAFHHDMPESATRLALPRALHDEGIRRYGFHGLSYEYIARRLGEIDPDLATGRVIAAHLGNGASLCAMRGGKSLDTTMGFTALDGLVMGTRCGSIDPGVVLYLLSQRGMRPDEVERLLYAESGLLGVSGLSSDMRALHQSDDPRAAEAIDLFTWRAAREVGALIASLGGLDGLVFTAGIGENDPLVRAMICERLAWMGLVLDPEANQRNAPLISAPASKVAVRVIPTDEESMIAIHTVNTLGLNNQR